MLPPENTPDDADFVGLQRSLVRHLRDPEHCPPPTAVEERRLAIYRHAVYANVAGLMADNYPRIVAVFSAERWQDMVRDYIIRHASKASAFVDVPLEFIDYLQHERQVPDDPPFLLELAHFDWLETLVGADQATIDMSAVQRDGDLLGGIPVLNPLLRLFTYRFPVHAINADYQPDSPPALATHIAAFRDLDNLYGFLDLNAAAARLLELLMADRGLSGTALFNLLANEMQSDDPAALAAAGSTILERMRARGAIVGTRCC